MSEVEFDPFQGGELAAVILPTAPQREVWMASQLGSETSLAFNESVSLRLRGALDVDALESALQALVVRHEALRSTFSDAGELLVAATGTWPVTLHRPASEATLAAVEARVVTTPFDLARGPLVRADLVVLGPAEHVLVLTAHHVVLDGWSTGVVLRELGALYAAEARASGAEASRDREGRRVRADLPPAASWVRYAEARAAYDDQEDVAWWLDTLRAAGPPAALDLPTDRPRPAVRTYASARCDVVLAQGVVEAVEGAAKALGATPFAALLAGFVGVLSRLAPGDDAGASFVVGIPSAGQALEGRAGRHLVGHAVNLLPVPLTVTGADTFESLVLRTKDGLYGAFEHAGVTYGRILEELALPRDPSRPPLVSIQFNLDQSLDPAALGFHPLECRLRTNPRAFENFELFVNASRTPEGLSIECQYNSDLFDHATIEGHLRAYEVWLRSATNAPSQAVATLPLLNGAEREAIVRLGTGPEIAPAAVLPALIAAACARTPDAPAVVDDGG